MPRLLTCIILSLIVMFAFQGTARSGERLALLIGNQNYKPKVGTLKYPHHDVDRIKAALKQIGFEEKDIQVVKDAKHGPMDRAINEYVRKLSNAGTGALGFFYYSGHGAANAGHHNYLIPVDVKTADDATLWDNSITQDEIIRRLSEEAPNATHFVVFDACRNELNLSAAAAKAIGADKGFIPVTGASNILIAYATAPNKTAADTGEFANILAKELVKPGMEVTQVFRYVQLDVLGYMNQEPWLSFGAIPKTYFTAAPEGPCNAVALTADGQKICRRPGDGQQFKDCEACPEMVVVPAGEVILHGELSNWNSFWQLFSSSDLRPAYKVRLAEPVAFSRSPVTFDEWGACVAARSCAGYPPSDEGEDRHDHPVVNVSWDDARTYLAWLSKRTGHAYRLLSEAERRYLSENNEGGPGECNNCDSVKSVDVFKGVKDGQPVYQPTLVPHYRAKTVPVHNYGVNAWGLYQVRDNVDEWVEDCWHVTYEGIPGDGAPWKAGDCESRTIVGGKVRESFFWVPYMEYRWGAQPRVRDLFTSFRVARTLDP